MKMENKNKIQELINSLINLTKHKKIEWNVITEYLEENRNEPLRRYMIINNEYYDTVRPRKQYLSEYNSYCTIINSGLIYVFAYYDNLDDDYYYILSVQNVSASNIIELNTKEIYQDEIRSLLFHIKNQFDNIDIFVDTIISKGKSLE